MAHLQANGAKAGSVLESTPTKACPGFTIRVHSEQRPGIKRLQGSFEVVSTGQGGYHTAGIVKLVQEGTFWHDATTFMDALAKLSQGATYVLDTDCFKIVDGQRT